MQLEEVYGEVFRVLKPGAIYVSYEWVATEKYDAASKEHVRIMDEINYGNGLPVSAQCALLLQFVWCLHCTEMSRGAGAWACIEGDMDQSGCLAEHPASALAATPSATSLCRCRVSSRCVVVATAALSKGVPCAAALQEMRTWKECEEAGTSVGFELVESRDLATACDACAPWCVPGVQFCRQLAI